MHSDIEPHDQLKTLQTLFNPDPRTEGLSGGIERYFEWMETARLIEQVPDRIRIEFDIARNVFIYSFYSYRLSMAAQAYAFGCVEKAIVEKAGRESFTLKERPQLGYLLDTAINEGWLTDDAFPKYALPPYSENYCKGLKEFWVPSEQVRKRHGYQGKRNELVHNPGSLDLPGHAAELIHTCACVINYLFRQVL